ncbi:glycosyltransferase family 39 protein [Pseudomonas frederiksbergensis]|uniref:glycosyltransferase family 39 protein n=1 Tax=Pseudomonas frederiksbergensis TaxID=104087 RepID=UPI000F48E098|nr:glycosyltransferase family 39 protein [Pseudomonas frederiksbergensis]RON43029.1 hypothetical protein BK667_29745 [Pseudomonas frederiksbergensis]
MKLNPGRQCVTVYVSLAAALIFGSYLRLRNITVDSLWLDEVFSLATSHPDNSLLEVCQRTLVDVHPPAYQIVLWVFYKLFGFSEWGGRYLSVVFGVFLIAAVFCLGKQLFNCRAGLISAWLAAINFYLITYSQETRSYELLALLTTVSFIAFVKAVRTRDRFHIAIYSLVATLLVNTHYFGFLVVAAQAFLVVCTLLERPLDRRLLYRFGLAGSFILLSVAPYVSYVYFNFHRQGFWLAPPNDRFFIELFNLYFGNFTLSVIYAVLVVVGATRLIKEERNREALRLFVFWIVACAIIPYVRSLYIQPVLTMRSSIVLLPALLVTIAYAISLIDDRWTQLGIAVIVLCFSMTPLFTDNKPIFTYANQLKPVSQMRDLVHEFIVRQIQEPLYARQAIEFNQYFKLLGSPKNVRNEDMLNKDLLSTHPPETFYFLASRIAPLDVKTFLSRYHIQLLSETEVGDSLALEFRSLPLEAEKK